MKISDKLAEMRGNGHSVPVGLDEILEDFDKRLSALETKKEVKPDFDELNRGQKFDPVVKTGD